MLFGFYFYTYVVEIIFTNIRETWQSKQEISILRSEPRAVSYSDKLFIDIHLT